jgi:hypothetical protein
VKTEIINSEKLERLIDWNTDALRRSLQQIVACRRSMSTLNLQVDKDEASNMDVSDATKLNPFDEVKEIISLPQLKTFRITKDEHVDDVSREVSEQLRHYVSNIASLYNNNHFHNFEHVSLTIRWRIIFH